MAKRGVTRPHMNGHAAEHEEKERDHGHMSPEGRREMLEMHHAQTLWIPWLIIMLGFWVTVSPFTFGYGVSIASPSGGRSVWLTDAARVAAMTWSDVVSGLLLVVFGWRALTPNRPVSLWACCFVGIWLSAAPIVFWAPTAAAYLNDTLVGALVIALAVLIPGMPNMLMFMKMGPEVPPGWTYNPSSWPQRWIMIATGFAGWLVSRYIAAFQLGYIDSAWDPFFGGGTERVLNSPMSHSWPISDAALGAFAYTFEFLMGFMGSPARWRTMPWMVTFFGILVIPLGLTHIFLVISQPVVVGSWCTSCLLAAAIMLPMIPLEVDEVLAMGQFLFRAKRRGEPLWRTFWYGGTVEEGGPDERSPALVSLPQQPRQVLKASVWGMSLPWNLIASAAIGVGLMFAPAALGKTGMPAHIDHLAGALIVTVSIVAGAEVIRPVRYANALLGLIVAIGPWMTGESGAPAAAATIAGAIVVVLAIPRGPRKERYGLWEKYIF